MLLNLFGAVGLVYMATLDYAKRQSWAHAYVRHELALDGLPLDEQDPDPSGLPLVERFNDEDKRAIFQGVTGEPVITQIREMERVKADLDNRINGTAEDRVQQTFLLGRLLLPFATAYPEREQLLACRRYFSANEPYQILRTRFRQAVSSAVEQIKREDQLRKEDPRLPLKSFHESIRVLFHAQTADPAEAFLSLALKGIPDDRVQGPAANVDAALDGAVNAQLDQLKKDYESLFSTARGQSADPAAPKKPDRTAQRAAVARLLFGLGLFYAEDALLSTAERATEKAEYEKQPTFGEQQVYLVGTETYQQQMKRAMVVCGVRDFLGAIINRGQELRRLSDAVQEALIRERREFTMDYSFLLDMVREQANLVRLEQKMLAGSRERLAGEETVVKERMSEINQLTQELEKARTATSLELRKLKEKSQEVFDLRSRIRDVLGSTQTGEEKIRQLEKQAGASSSDAKP
ncbi:MAG: hypothetical protein ACKO23_16000 [Gemmataceae bacterium]